MRTAAGCLAHNGGTLQLVEVVAELFGSRKSPLGRQHVHRLTVQALARHKGQSPILLGGVALPFPDVVQVRRFREQKR